MVQPMSTSDIYYSGNYKSIHAIFPDGNLGLLLQNLAGGGGRVARPVCTLQVILIIMTDVAEITDFELRIDNTNHSKPLTFLI